MPDLAGLIDQNLRRSLSYIEDFAIEAQSKTA
jgi:hypothetical protein